MPHSLRLISPQDMFHYLMLNETGRTAVDTAQSYLQAGQLVGIPTDTVYGLAGNALDASVVAQIFAVKNRPTFDPLIVHFANKAAAQRYTLHWPPAAEQLADAFWPGPLTLVLPRTIEIPDLVTSGLETVAVRVPDHPLTMALLEKLPFPLAAPSANPFGYISPTRPDHVTDQLGTQIAYVLDGGSCKVGLESTIVGFTAEGQPQVLRLGGIPVERIEAVVGPVQVQTHSTDNPAAPGMLTQHYAPRTPLVVTDPCACRLKTDPARTGIISYLRRFPNYPADHQVVLAPDGKLETAARNLFAAMRKLDAQQLEIILAEPLPETGLGRAINDRLRRAAAGPHA